MPIDKWQYLTTRRGGGLVVRSGRSTKLITFYELGGRVAQLLFPSEVARCDDNDQQEREG